MATIGQRIRQVREGRAFSQADLAERAGISKSFLSDLENDKTGPSGKNLLLIADALDTTTDYLLKGSGDERPTPEEGKPVEIPSELQEYAEDNGLSFSATRMLVQMHRGLIAMRSEAGRSGYGREYWASLDATRIQLEESGK